MKYKVYTQELLTYYYHGVGNYNMPNWSRLFCHRGWYNVEHWSQIWSRCQEMWQRKLFVLFPLSQVIWVCSWNPASKVRITNWQNIINIPVYEIKGFSFCKSLAFDKYCIHPISTLNMTTMIIMYSLRFLCFISESPVCPIAISDLIATMYYMHA